MSSMRLEDERLDVLPVRGSLSLVLPAYNEAANLEAVVRRALAVLPEFVEELEIVVVNDGSRDETGAIAERLSREDSRVRVIHHPVNRGYGAALRSGFAATRGELVMFMDADQQFDPADFLHLAPFLPHADIVAGYRIRRRDPWIRLVYAAIFNAAMRLLFGITVRDIDCAFKVIRGDLVRSLDLRMDGALVNTELLAKAQRAGATIVEVGVRHYPRLSGEPSGGNVRVILRAMREVLQLWWLLLRYQPPRGLGRGRPQPRTSQLLRTGALAFLGLSATWWLVRRLRQRGRR
ncbi:MAG: glycosyltransferase family 2 protein [Thermomicrobium sp.]|nr:glycosyltransferase family 2 protein [Thermomicrobium sp.]MDW8059175.1 glycosyltransferase family 2 protein [Thermomicrobium sp.]